MTKIESTLFSIRRGIAYTNNRKGLVLLVYLANVLAAGLLALPMFSAVMGAIGDTGHGKDLISNFDLTFWVEMWPEVLPTIQGLIAGLTFLIPLYLLWKTALHMGLIYALHQGAIWPFSGGLGHYTGTGLLIALLFLPLRLILVILVLFLAVVMAGLWQGEVGTVIINAWMVPGLLITGFALIDLMQRYARIANVVRHDSPLQAMVSGMRWPIRFGEASFLYVGWFFAGILVMALPMIIGVSLKTVWVGFLIQQVFLLLRAGLTVAWVGSEVDLFERTWESEMPLIAEG